MFEFITDNQKRNIYNSLPQIFSDFHHSDGEEVYDSAYLVEYWENVYNQWDDSLSVLLDFDGDWSVFTSDQLNSFAPYFGFAGEYFDESWSDETKIKLFQGVFNDPFLWRFRGSTAVFEFMASSLGVEAYLTTDEGFIAGVSKAGDVCGNGSEIGQIVVKYPNAYGESSIQKGIIDYLVQYFIPVHIETTLLPF